jgi:hypothetical protein
MSASLPPIRKAARHGTKLITEYAGGEIPLRQFMALLDHSRQRSNTSAIEGKPDSGNPNLHDLSSHMAYRIELWDRHAVHIRWVVAATSTVTIGHAALDAAIASYPTERFTLRQGIRVIRDHVPKGP